MTASFPPAARGSFRFYLERVRLSASLVASLLVAAVCVRFVAASASFALDRTSPNFEARSRGTGAQTAPGQPQGKSARARIKEAEVPPRETGHSVRVSLSVTAGPPRSEVYVAGHFVGNTPFLGDTGCKVGQRLKVEVVPTVGAPLTFEPVCSPGTIRLEDGPN